MALRGLLSELERQARAADRERKAAIRQAEQARKAEKRAQAQLTHAAKAERKHLAKQAREAHIAAMEAEVEIRNLELSEIYQEIDSLLAATLDVDDYVDLNTLRSVAEHPPFDRPDLETAIPAPRPIPDPLEPVGPPLAAPTGILGFFGRKKHARAAEAYERALAEWHAELTRLSAVRKTAAEEHAAMEAQRLSALEAARARYTAECSAREVDAAEHNQMLDELIVNLGYGTADAVQEYLRIVLSNSVYPSHFPVKHEFQFDPATAELRLQVLVPGPGTLPDTKSYRYVKSSDEITGTSLSQKARRDRYTGAVHAVAVRSMHEVFEADLRGLVKTISLEVGTETIDPATGQESYISFVATSAERDSFLEFDLSSVVPAATLAHLGAALSKNPFGLIPADTAGIRRS